MEVTHVRKAVVVEYDATLIKGTHASVLAAKSEGEEVIERKTVTNKGWFSLSFPGDYSGTAFVAVRGSKSGEDSDTIKV